MARNEEKALTLWNKWHTFKNNFHSGIGAAAASAWDADAAVVVVVAALLTFQLPLNNPPSFLLCRCTEREAPARVRVPVPPRRREVAARHREGSEEEGVSGPEW
jgi:hypothetical protein